MRVIDKILLVSLGSIGKRHIKNIQLLRPEADIAVLRTHHKTRAGVPKQVENVFFDIAEALDYGPSLAIISGPASEHKKYLDIFVNHSIPTFVEKPISNTSDGLDLILKNAAKKTVPIMVGYCLRFHELVIQMKDLICSAKHGRVLSVSMDVGQHLPQWRPSIDYRESVSASKILGGGALLELSHELDLTDYFFGSPANIFAALGDTKTLEIDVEDTVDILMFFRDPEFNLSLHLDFIQRSPCRKYKVIFEHGIVELDLIKNHITIFDSQSNERKCIISADRSATQTMYERELIYFFQCYEKDMMPYPDGKQGLKIMKIIDATRISAQHAQIVALK